MKTAAKFILLISFLSHFLIAPNCSAQSNMDFFFNNSNNYKNVKIQEVVSVDTIIIENYLRRGERIKLIGLKAPKLPERKEPVERDQYGFIKKEEKEGPTTPIEEEALEFAKELLEGKTINLEFDINQKNKNLETVAYVFLVENNTFANAEILRQGYADLQITPPNLKYEKELHSAYQEARKEKRGLQNR